jgi:hypothetical protein
MPRCTSSKRVCTDLSKLPSIHVANHFAAAGVFGQIDVLSAPGAGLRHLDVTMSSLYQTYFPEDENLSTVQMEPMPSPLGTTQCFVRTYGSEPEM